MRRVICHGLRQRNIQSVTGRDRGGMAIDSKNTLDVELTKFTQRTLEQKANGTGTGARGELPIDL